MGNTISLTYDYYGDKSFGRRIFWIEETDDFIWADEIVAWAERQKRAGNTIEVTNPKQVPSELLNQII